MSEVWILGAAGRTGRAIAAELAMRQIPLVLVGRDAAKLQGVAATAGEARVQTADSVGAMAAAIAAARPSVVVNTIGPFAETAAPIARACAPATHYVDIANELDVVLELLAMNDTAVRDGRCIVTGAGWGLVATESVVLKLCEGRPTPARVRVDNLAYVNQPGPVGPTVAASVIDGLAYDAGRIYEDGRLTRVRLGSHRQQFTLPDGGTAVTGCAPTGELEAAYRASGAPFVVAGFPAAPGAAAMFAVAALLAVPGMRGFARRRFARLTPPPPKRDVSWARAVLEWPDGDIQVGWLRAGEGYDFLAKAAAGVAARLVRGEGRPGAFTPGALFGPDLAVEAGGTFMLGGAPSSDADVGTRTVRSS